MFSGIVTEVIRQKIHEIEQDRLRIYGVVRNLVFIYTNYGDHLVYDHNDEV